jgi:hypothetical protein
VDLESIGVHAVFGAVAAGGGYWAFKTKNREMALLCAGAQPSIAIALSLWDLGATFGDMTSSVTAGVYGALSMKMYHMVGGIGAGLVQEIVTTARMPAQEEEKRTAQSVKDAVMEGVEARLSEIDHRVQQVGALLSTVPDRVASSNSTMLRTMDEQRSEMIQAAEKTSQAVSLQIKQETKAAVAETTALVEQGLVKVEKSIATVRDEVTNSMAATRHAVSTDVSNAVSSMRIEVDGMLVAVKHESERVTERMQRDLDATAASFGDNVRTQTKQIADEAARQGGQVIIDVGTKVAATLERTTHNSLAASIKIADAASSTEAAANRLISAHRDTR